MTELLTTRQLAELLGVSDSSIKRWIDSGRITAARTPGGHRRIALVDALNFAREERLLGAGGLLGHESRADPSVSAEVSDSLFAALTEPDLPKAQEILIGSWLAGQPIAGVWDQLVGPALRRIGNLWQDGPGGIAREHWATDVVVQVMSQLRSMLGAGTQGSRLAIGFAPELDPYCLPSIAASMVVSEAGWRSRNLGPMTPLGAVLASVRSESPDLVWMCISRNYRADEMDHAIGQIRKTTDCIVAVGGRGVPADWEAAGERLFKGSSMSELASHLLEIDSQTGASHRLRPRDQENRERLPGGGQVGKRARRGAVKSVDRNRARHAPTRRTT